MSWEYSCIAHPLKNFCEDIIYIPNFKADLQRSLFLSEGIKKKGMSGKIFRVLSSKLYGKEYATVLYLALRLSSINYLFLRLKKAKLAINQLLLCVMNEKDERDIDERHELTPELATIAIDPKFWKYMDRCITIFESIYKCLGILESDTSTIETAYALFVYRYVHIMKVVGEEDVCDQIMPHLFSFPHPRVLMRPFLYNFRIRLDKIGGRASIYIGIRNLK